MLHFFDYLFYRAAESYRKNEKEDPGFRLKGLIAVTLLQIFNTLSILFLLELFFERTIASTFFFIAIPSVLCLVNVIRYNSDKHNYDVLKEKWGAKVEKSKIKGGFVLLYIIVSIGLVVGLLILTGGKKWPEVI